MAFVANAIVVFVAAGVPDFGGFIIILIILSSLLLWTGVKIWHNKSSKLSVQKFQTPLFQKIAQTSQAAGFLGDRDNIHTAGLLHEIKKAFLKFIVIAGGLSIFLLVIALLFDMDDIFFSRIIRITLSILFMIFASWSYWLFRKYNKNTIGSKIFYGQIEQRYIFYAFLGILIGSALALFSAIRHVPIPDTFWGYLLAFVGFQYSNIYVHELGHALAGVIVQFKLKSIMIGTGQAWIRKQFHGVQIVITTNVEGGRTLFDIVPHPLLKLRYFITTLGGVAAQWSAVIITMIIFNIHVSDIVHPHHLSIGTIFIYANVVMIIWNLIPRYHTILGIKIPSDGLILFTIPVLKEHELLRIFSIDKIRDAYNAYMAKKFYEAEQKLEECLKIYPEVFSLKLMLSIAFIKQLNLKKAQTFLETALNSTAENAEGSILYNTLAWAYFIELTESALRKADEYSQKAVALNSSQREVIGTRGCLLIETGELERGIALLETIVGQEWSINEMQKFPIGFIYLAYAYYLKNEYDRAIPYFKNIEVSKEFLDKDHWILLSHVIKETDDFKQFRHTLLSQVETKE